MRCAAILPCALVLALTAAPAAASEGKKPPTDADRNLDISAIGAPIVWQGRVVNYIFVSTRLKLAPGQDLMKLRTKEPYFRDALVRAAHRTPFVDAHDLARVDERALKAALLREAVRISGPHAFVAAEVRTQQPRQTRGLPRTGAEPAPAGRAIIP